MSSVSNALCPLNGLSSKKLNTIKTILKPALQAEEELILKHVSDGDALILFDEKGKRMGSTVFAQFINKHSMILGELSCFALEVFMIWRFFAQTSQWNGIFIAHDVSTPTRQSSST